LEEGLEPRIALQKTSGAELAAFECRGIQEKSTPKKLQVPEKRRTGGKLVSD
jgi:hypothetical protein